MAVWLSERAHSCNGRRGKVTAKRGSALRTAVRLFAPLCLLATAGAQGATCPSNINADRCTANDLQPTGTQIISGPSACTEGETVSATVRVFFGNGGGANQRYDVGFFIGDNGGSPLGGGSCTFESLQPVGAPPDLTSGSGPYESFDGDACGDISASDPTYRDITTDQLLCEDSDGDGLVDVGYVITYGNQGSASDCSDPSDSTLFYPNPPKCLADLDYDLPITVEPAPSIEVTKVATPQVVSANGGTVTFDVTYYVGINNTSSQNDPVTITSLSDDPYGNLDGQGTCALPLTLAAGQTSVCSFTVTETGVAGDVLNDTVTASGTDNENNAVSGSDTASVIIVDAPPVAGAIRLFKIALPRTLDEPGGIARYTLLLFNPGTLPVTAETLTDDLYGDLDGRGSCALPQRLTPDAPFYTCQFSESVSGQPGDVITDIVTVGGTDDNGNPLSAQDPASVTIRNLGSKISVVKIPSPARLEEPGGDVTFSVQLQNESAVDEVTITSLVDSVHGDLDGQGSCSVPQTLAANGGIYQCQFVAAVTGVAGGFETDVISASGTDSDGEAVTADGAATVSFYSGSGLAPAGIVVSKTPSPSAVSEPGANVTFSIRIANASQVRGVVLDTLEDSVHGSLDGQGTCRLPINIPGGDTYRCEFSALVAGRGGEQEVNVVTASGFDNSVPVPQAVSDSALARVTILDSQPGLSLTKGASPFLLRSPGGEVRFTLAVSNTSGSDTIEIDSLTDSVYGDLNGRGDCSLPQTLLPGDTYTCSFVANVSGDSLSLHRNRALASGSNDQGVIVTAQASASVVILGALATRAIGLWGNWGIAVCSLLLALFALRALRRR